jgi:hypothetical protein
LAARRRGRKKKATRRRSPTITVEGGCGKVISGKLQPKLPSNCGIITPPTQHTTKKTI